MKQQLLQLFGIVAILFINATFVLGQGTVTGQLVDSETGEGLISASVIVKGTTNGTITDASGNFSLSAVSVGAQTLVLSYMGYETSEVAVTVTDGGTTDLGAVKVNSGSVGLGEVQVMASLAKDRQTPVAASTIKGAEIEALVGNQEFPEILRGTPSVYVTKQGGGFGDARINVRGFDQRNVAVMINGIPVNDMENGWVYWSNWAGLSDVTSTVQVQRGLGASKLAVPSVGGSINIVTNAADFKKGGAVSVTGGNNGYQKYAVVLSSGQMDNGFAITAQATHTRGSTYAQGTNFEAYSYFLSSTYKINSNQTIAGTVIGAPQWHHQRLSNRFDNLSLQTFQDQGRDFNVLYGDLDGEQFSWRRNFYHKPKAFLNHYWDINEKTNLKTSAYISLGIGGGTGPRGRLANPTQFDSFDGLDAGIHDANGQVRFNDIVAYNQGDSITGGDFGERDGNPFITANSNDNGNRDGFIRRASMNYHNWYGVLSTLESKVSDDFTLVAGIDARYYKGEHFRRVENLLGNTSYESFADVNAPNGRMITTEAPATFGNFLNRDYRDRSNVIAYYNDGLVGWLGAFVQGEYTTDKLSAFVSLSGSNQGFKRIDYFNYEDSDPEQSSDWQNFLGGTVKAGANYNLSATSNVFVNAGFFSRQPIFDNVFANFRNDLNEDVQNQSVTALEAGYGYNNGILDIDANVYYTVWGNRQFDVSYDNDLGETEQYIFENVAQAHAGFELEAKARVLKQLDLRGMVSINNWVYADDFTATGTNLETGATTTSIYYAEGVKVADAAQTTMALGINVYPVEDARVYVNVNYANNLYAQFDIFDDNNRNSDLSLDERQASLLPSYTLVDAGAQYAFMFGDNKLTVRLNVNNLFDTWYISEMYTNDKTEDDPSTTDVDEFLAANRGFYGFGRTWNAGIKFNF